MRKTVRFTLSHISEFKTRLLAWGNTHDEVAWLDSNNHTTKHQSYDALMAVDGLTAIVTDAINGFEDLETYQTQVKDWIFGYLSYDLKNDTAPITSKNRDGLEFPELYFFQPKKIITIQGTTVSFMYLNMVADEINQDFEALTCATKNNEKENTSERIPIKMRIFKEEYFSKIQQILAHIQRGDIYEVNFCQEFYAEDVVLDPLPVYHKLNSISEAPFATYLKIFDKYLMCASPERYLKKTGTQVISQPIKGTAARSEDPIEDDLLKTELQTSTKEQSENIMIVDLVRNDLSKFATKGSVQVAALCAIHSFKQVHQMISTISCEVDKSMSPIQIIKATFPMGSMTGAPKLSAMHIIETTESFKRGLYSGAVGYMTPEGDFDFNVVIRSILYNKSTRYISFAVGSAITSKSEPKKEYEECLLKAKAMREVLEN